MIAVIKLNQADSVGTAVTVEEVVDLPLFQRQKTLRRDQSNARDHDAIP